MAEAKNNGSSSLKMDNPVVTLISAMANRSVWYLGFFYSRWQGAALLCSNHAIYPRWMPRQSRLLASNRHVVRLLKALRYPHGDQAPSTRSSPDAEICSRPCWIVSVLGSLKSPAESSGLLLQDSDRLEEAKL